MEFHATKRLCTVSYSALFLLAATLSASAADKPAADVGAQGEYTVADSFNEVANPGPLGAIGKELHQFIWEQKRLEASFGIDHAGNYSGRAVCNQETLCQLAVFRPARA